MSGNCGYENKNLLEGFIIEQTAPMKLSYLNERGMINFNLDLNQKLNLILISSLNIQEINEDYIICTDAWDEIRGLPTIFSLFFSLLLLPFILFLFVILVMMVFDSWDSFFSEFIIFLIYLIYVDAWGGNLRTLDPAIDSGRIMFNDKSRGGWRVDIFN